MWTLAAPGSLEEIVRHSRFRALATRVDQPEGVPDALAALTDPTATHTCWAWRIGTRYRFHDAQEPAGTAGRPILAAIDGQGLDHVLVAVNRHFGGIKLGAGGLARAYGGAASRCLQAADRIEVRPRIRLRGLVPFDAVGGLHVLIERHGAVVADERWSPEGLDLALEVEEDIARALREAVSDLTRGRARLEVEP